MTSLKDRYEKMIFKGWANPTQPRKKETSPKYMANDNELLNEWLKELGKKLSKLQGEREKRKSLLTTCSFVPSQKHILRAELFKAIERVVPEAISSLADEVFPVYLQAFPRRRRPWKLEQVKGEKTLLQKLKAWGEKWNFEADWALDIACFLLSTWASRPSSLGKIDCLPTGEGLPPPVVPLLRIYPWEPWEEAEEEFDRRAKRTLKKHKEVVKKLYKKAGWEEPPEKRARSGPVQQHFDWLALYQVGGRSQKSIAIMDNVTRESVSKGIKKVAKQLEMPLRLPNRSGRPRKEEK